MDEIGLHNNAVGFVLLLFSLLACEGGAGVSEHRFLVEEILTRPTRESVQLSLVPAEPLELRVEYGDVPGSLDQQTPRQTRQAEELAVFALEGLRPGGSYRYRVLARRPGERSFVERPEGRFRTLYADPDTVVRFGYAADSHITGRFNGARCQGERRAGKRRAVLGVANFERILQQLAAADLDFVVAAGDNFMTHAPNLVSCDATRALGDGTVRTAAQADARYRLALSPRFWGRVGPSLPLVFVLGNHDGEARFGDASGSYSHYSDTRRLSRGARSRHLPSGVKVRSGGEGDTWYSFASGPARFIVLDVMSGPSDFPRSAEDWTLGEAQLRWFEQVVRESTEPWTFVFLEHLVGGVTSPDGQASVTPGGPPGQYHYGRGGLRSTVDGSLRTPFRGEQARIQRLLSEHGVALVFHGHDHVAVVGEKQDERGRGEGVYYAAGGQVAGAGDGPGWSRFPWFQEQYDYDGDGRADFLDAENGTLEAGFYRVTVYGRKRVDVAFTASRAEQPEGDARDLLSLSLYPDASSSPDL
jgi:hypothetical protein